MYKHCQVGSFRPGKGKRTGLVWVLVAMICGVSAASGIVDGEVARLQSQVKWLSDSLAVARAEVDMLRARADRGAVEIAGGQGANTSEGDVIQEGQECSILEVNEDLGLAVVSAGRRQGLRPGMRLAVMRGERMVARLRIVDVRPMVAGAVIERTGRDFPGRKDRVVVATGSKE